MRNHRGAKVLRPRGAGNAWQQGDIVWLCCRAASWRPCTPDMGTQGPACSAPLSQAGAAAGCQARSLITMAALALHLCSAANSQEARTCGCHLIKAHVLVEMLLPAAQPAQEQHNGPWGISKGAVHRHACPAASLPLPSLVLACIMEGRERGIRAIMHMGCAWSQWRKQPGCSSAAKGTAGCTEQAPTTADTGSRSLGLQGARCPLFPSQIAL